MTFLHQQLNISTPGRICLFGEHQDYLHLPVIPAAISLRISVEGKRRDDSRVHIALPDINAKEHFTLRPRLRYRKQKDYFKSVVNVLRRHGFTFSKGVECIVRSRIPIQAGTSSSSALVVSWVNFLAQMSDQELKLPPELLARYAHEAEVVEFGEAGGMMDQYATAFGGVTVIDFFPELKVQRLNVRLGTFVLGDSMQPKDTQAILKRVKNGVLDIVRRLSANHESFFLPSATVETAERFKSDVQSDELKVLVGTIRNHLLTGEARELLSRNTINHRRIGELLSEHHAVLRDVQNISTPKIDRMLDAAMNAGACGGKINGSGGGGCMFAYAPESAHQVAEAIERAGGKAYIVSVDEGTRVERTDQ